MIPAGIRRGKRRFSGPIYAHDAEEAAGRLRIGGGPQRCPRPAAAAAFPWGKVARSAGRGDPAAADETSAVVAPHPSAAWRRLSPSPRGRHCRRHWMWRSVDGLRAAAGDCGGGPGGGYGRLRQKDRSPVFDHLCSLSDLFMIQVKRLQLSDRTRFL